MDAETVVDVFCHVGVTRSEDGSTALRLQYFTDPTSEHGNFLGHFRRTTRTSTPAPTVAPAPAPSTVKLLKGFDPSGAVIFAEAS